MRRLFAIVFLLSFSGYYNGQRAGLAPSHTVTFVSDRATPMNVVSATALQSRVPIGIVIGQQQDKLCQTLAAFNIRDLAARDALAQVQTAAGYSLREENGVLVLVAPDLASWERAALSYRFENIGGDPRVTMSVMATRLTGWMRMRIGGVTTFAGETLYSPDSQEISMPPLRDASVEEIANLIITRGDKGIWILHGATEKFTDPSELTMTIYSYHDDEAAISRLACTLN